MVRTLAIMTMTALVASSALADEIAIKPKIISSQIKTDAERLSVNGINMNLENDNSDDSTNGLGFGVDFEFKLADRAKLGSEVSYTTYEEDDSEATDLALGGFLAYDFIAQDNLSVYGKAGLSLHSFALEEFESASLLNTDLGLGVAFNVAPSVDLGGEYKYSTTLGKGDMSSEESSSVELKDFSIQRNDISVFMAFKF
ncbi:MAG TPA: outer membrane beta-barrel protein [Oligoflexus sp.]|uniref:outer membrane protein n=1 Tax=Oligoflexus sp. TaxID=1971216 RepID=UPI002D234CF4|nr:outer membrane beta-barrel protein [Oligoflexus sp.]HYX39567.1 outer membrane beta-barrel protein [Oligoflexus sp.]